MLIRHLMLTAAIGTTLSLPAAAEAAPLYALSQGIRFDELLGYDLAGQNPSAIGVDATSAKLLDTAGLPASSINSIAASGSMLYALSRGTRFDELLGYDLAAQNPSAIGVDATSAKLLDTAGLPASSIVSIAASGSMFYALSQGTRFDELLSYDLTGQNPSAIGVDATSAKLLDTAGLPASSIVSIAASGSMLYALSQGTDFDELLSYDLAAQNPSAIGVDATSVKLLDTAGLPASSILSIAVSGSMLYALSQGTRFDELLSYDLAGQNASAIGVDAASAKLLDTAGLPASSIVGIVIDGSITPSSVPLPGGLPLAALGFLTLAAVGKLRLVLRHHCAS